MEKDKAERLIDGLLELQAQTTAAEENRHPQARQLNADRDIARDELLEYIGTLKRRLAECRSDKDELKAERAYWRGLRRRQEAIR